MALRDLWPERVIIATCNGPRIRKHKFPAKNRRFTSLFLRIAADKRGIIRASNPVILRSVFFKEISVYFELISVIIIPSRAL